MASTVRPSTPALTIQSPSTTSSQLWTMPAATSPMIAEPATSSPARPEALVVSSEAATPMRMPAITSGSTDDGSAAPCSAAHDVLGGSARLSRSLTEQLSHRGARGARAQHLRSLGRCDESAVDLAVLDRRARLGLVPVAMDVERVGIRAELLLELAHGGRWTGHADRQVARLEPGARPGEQRQHDGHDDRHDHQRRERRWVAVSGCLCVVIAHSFTAVDDDNSATSRRTARPRSDGRMIAR